MYVCGEWAGLRNELCTSVDKWAGLGIRHMRTVAQPALSPIWLSAVYVCGEMGGVSMSVEKWARLRNGWGLGMGGVRKYTHEGSRTGSAVADLAVCRVRLWENGRG